MSLEATFSFGCKAFCFFGVFYTTYMLCEKYYANHDSSQVSAKLFNKSPIGRYPSFTLCIYQKKGGLLLEDVSAREFGIGRKVLNDILHGTTEDMNKTLSKLSFENVTIRLEDLLEQFAAEDIDYKEYDEWKPLAHNSKKLPLTQSYQDPTTICYTYDTKYHPSVSLNALKMKVNITKFLKLDEGKMYIQIHYPGLMIRDMKSFIHKIGHLEYVGPIYGNNQIDYQISSISLMRFRENANDRCDPKLIDDNAEWMAYVTNKLGCKPFYWKTLVHHDYHGHEALGLCTTRSQMKNLMDYWPMDGGHLANGVFEHYDRPCQRMTVFTNVMQRRYGENDNYDGLKLKFQLQNQFYQEILNVRDFGLDSLWGNIGGYVGIFCGYSLLQAPGLIIAGAKQIFNILSSVK